MLTHLRANWPVLCAILFFLTLVALIGPWSEIPLNDDWQYAHFAKTLAESGTFRVDVPVAPSVIGQSLLAWPVIRIFGFSHLALRMLTLALSVLILVELDYLLAIGAVGAAVRFTALSLVVANPIFLHLSTTFMTENYGYVVALLAACIWFRGKKTESTSLAIVAATVAGLSFWIRQFSALVFPALLLAEWIASGANLRNGRGIF
ncbi:MAG TPA: glycosyltransferase family 39 protein, partial [Gemmatimonadaceae bacterium]